MSENDSPLTNDHPPLHDEATGRRVARHRYIGDIHGADGTGRACPAEAGAELTAFTKNRRKGMDAEVEAAARLAAKRLDT